MTATRAQEGGGPPPGWPASAVPRDPPLAAPAVSASIGGVVVPVAEVAMTESAAFAFPPVEPGFKRGATRAAPAPLPPQNDVVVTPTPLAALPPPVVPAAAPVAATPTVIDPIASAPVVPAIVETPAAALPPAAPTPSREVPVAAKPVAKATYVSSGPRSRLAVLAVIGVVLIGGTALGSFLVLRSSSASPTEETARPAKNPKKAGKKQATATHTSFKEADEPVVEDTPTPTMQAEPDPPAEPTADASATAVPTVSPKRALPLRRFPQPKR